MTGIIKLGKYQIRRELGKGAMGVVYEGFDPVIERVVAIKTMKAQQLNPAEAADVLARFKREAQAAGRLNHPGIVAVYDYGEAVAEGDDATQAMGADAAANNSVAFIAMEFVKGRELRDYFETNERFPIHEVGRLMGEILSALGHAHSNGVTHRDIKPANLIVLDDGRIKIADFGIARVEKSELTQTGTVLGTPSYMSPEQFMGLTVDGRSDLFSCGVVLYQFLTGEKPFTGNATTIMYKVLREEPLAPSMLNLALPQALDAVVKKAIAKNPDERFQNAAEFAAALQSAIASPSPAAGLAGASDATVVGALNMAAAPVAAAPANTATAVNSATRSSAAAAPATKAAAVAPPPQAPGKSNKVLLAVLGGCAVVAAGLGYMYLGKDRAGDAPVAQNAGAGYAASPAAQPTAPVAKAAASNDPPQEPGNVIISSLGLVDPQDPKFKGDAAAAQAESRADAKRQLVEKVLSLYVDNNSLNSNYPLLEQKLMSQSGNFIKTVLTEGAPVTGKDGLIATETRAVVKVREIQKSLNQLSKDERVDFIRNNGDPTVSLQMTVANADTGQNMPPVRSVLAENVLKERIKSFGFRIWSNEGDTKTGPNAKVADFVIQGEAKLKQLSAKLPASGLTITKTVLTSWTVKAIDKASGEEIYLNTVTPKGQSWANEDQALADIGKLMGEEFSKGFFLQHFNFGVYPASLNISGLPDASTAQLLLREMRGMRQVIDVQMQSDSGKFLLQLPQGNAADLIQDGVLKPLNTKMGQPCFSIAGSNNNEISVSFAAACAAPAVRAKLETAPPAGLMSEPAARGKGLLKGGAPSV